MPGVNKAELIEGVVHMPSPVRINSHSKPHARIVTLLGVYEAATPGTEVGDNGSLRLDLDNMPQPDAYLRIHESRGGQSRISSDDYLEGAPELVIEIAGTSAAVDLHSKLVAYRRNGVREYVVWLTDDHEIRAMRLVDGVYVPIAPDDAGVVRLETFPGLWLNVPALLELDASQPLKTLQQGLAGPEHAAFREKLQSTAK